MKKIFEACKAGGIEPPKEVWEFFNYMPPDAGGVEVELDKAVRSWSDNGGRAGFEVNLSKLPKDVTLIRFYNSW